MWSFHYFGQSVHMKLHNRLTTFLLTFGTITVNLKSDFVGIRQNCYLTRLKTTFTSMQFRGNTEAYHSRNYILQGEINI